LAQLNVNLADVNENDAEGGSFTILPRDRYLLKIIEGDVKENSKRTGMLYDYKAEVVDGEFAGAKIFGNINVTHSNLTAQKIGQAQLKALALAQGQDPAAVNDTEQYNWAEFYADVDVESYTQTKPGQQPVSRERNVIKKFIHAGNADSAPIGKEEPKPANDNVKASTTAANSNLKPAAAPAGTAGGAARSMPWKK
jgi:hypothetical protein